MFEDIDFPKRKTNRDENMDSSKRKINRDVVNEPTMSPFLMDDKEFEAVSHRQYKVRTKHVRKYDGNYQFRMDKQVRTQIALMNELLGFKKSINFEEMERL